MNKRGFTLLELLMVVIIIAILASIALPQYIRATEKARASEALQLLGALRSSENRYASQSPSGAYTGVVTELDFEQPATLQFWTFANVTTGAAGRARYNRSAGAYSGQYLGIFLTNGNICGNFAPMGLSLTCP